MPEQKGKRKQVMGCPLTDAGVRNYKAPAAGREEFADGTVPGLLLRVAAKSARLPEGSKRFILTYKVGNRRGKIAIGEYPVVSLEEAREKAREARRLVAQGIDPAEERARAASIEEAARRAAEELAREAEKLTFKAVAERFIAEEAPRRYAQPKTATSLLIRHAIPALGKKQVGAVTSEDIETLVGRVAKKAMNSGRARANGTTANRLLVVLRTLFKWTRTPEPRGAGLKRHVHANPVADVERPVDEQPSVRALEPDEVKRLWAACEGLGFPAGHAVKLILLTGARRSEIGMLRAAEMDLDGQVLRLQVGRKGTKLRKRKWANATKEGWEKRIPLSADAVAVLRSCPPPQNEPFHVFWTGGERSREGAKAACIGHVATQLRDTTGIPDLTLHMLRHTALTFMDRAGVDPYVAKLVAGHAVDSMHDRYTHGSAEREQRKLAAAEMLAAKIREAVEGKQAGQVVQFPGGARGERRAAPAAG